MITVQEIAKEFGVAVGTVYVYLAPNSRASGQKVERVREYAISHGWAHCDWGNHNKSPHYWFNGCFLTHSEEVKRMEELRGEGYSNIEIAKKIGRGRETIRRAIGKQPPDMTKKNRAMARKIDAQKNAARKQYVIDKSVNDYNKLVEEVRSVEAHLSKIKQDLAAKEQAVQKNARRTVKTPSISFATTEIAG